MVDEDVVSRDLAVRRLFVMQSTLVVVILALIGVGYFYEQRSLPDDEVEPAGAATSETGSEAVAKDAKVFGSFWFAFLAGGLGASVAMSRRLARSKKLAAAMARTNFAVVAPILFGCLMAGVTYILFMSGVCSGDAGGGFLTTNLWPNFTSPGGDGVAPSVTQYLRMHPSTLRDVGKLLVWAFIAGYSERFVTGILSQLESRGTKEMDEKGEAAPES